VANDAPHLWQRRPDTVVQLLHPRIDRDEPESALMAHRRAGKMTRHFDDVGMVHDMPPADNHHHVGETKVGMMATGLK
jgi:hypothetical protein